MVKKVVRRLTSWYVEPRWVAEQALDARTIDFASEAYNNLHRMERELEALRRQNVRIKLELVAAVERFRSAQAEIDALAIAVAELGVVVQGTAMQDDLRVLGKEVGSLLEPAGRGDHPGHRARLRRVRTPLPWKQ